MLFGLLSSFQAVYGRLAAGKVVCWGTKFLSTTAEPLHTNWVLEVNQEMVTNVIALAATDSGGALLKSDGTVAQFGNHFGGGDPMPPGLTNVQSLSLESGLFVARTRDGKVAVWGGETELEQIFSSLTNVSGIMFGYGPGAAGYLALRKDGTVLFWNPMAGNLVDPATGLPVKAPASEAAGPTKPGEFPFQPVRFHGGGILSNVVGMACFSNSAILLKRDGTVIRLRDLSSEETSSEVVKIGGAALSDVSAISTSAFHALALKRDGTVVAWDIAPNGAASVPADLSNVVAIAAADNMSMALKRDGTVVAWGANEFGQTSVPAGLSNVVAIGCAGPWSYAITTGQLPSSVFITPHGRMEVMEREADLIFKGRVISSRAVTNELFPVWGKTHATQFRIITLFKGTVLTNEPVFWHITGEPNGWGGGDPPSWHQFEPGQSYLIFAARLGRPQYLYQVPDDATNRPDEFRQLYRDGVTRTLDARPLVGQLLKEAHWFELNLLLNDSRPTNVMYAIERLDYMSLAGRRDDRWSRTDDFKRIAVLNALLSLCTATNSQVACRAIDCFETESNAAVRLAPFASALVGIANQTENESRCFSAIDALSGIQGEAVSNSLARLSRTTNDSLRIGAVRLLPRFPLNFAETLLRERAKDKSAEVRSVVADVIGEEKLVHLLPTLAMLFTDPVGRDPLIKPLTTELLRAGRRWSNIGDVHTSAGLALVKFAPEQVAEILQTNLDDPGFHINFVSKLAEQDAGPWLPELINILEQRLKYVEEFLKLPPLDPRRFDYQAGDQVLIGTYAKCWEDVRQHLLKMPAEKLVSGEWDHHLDVLEKTARPVPICGGCGSQEAEGLFELYWTKGLTNRVAEVRRRYDKLIGWWFDDFILNHRKL